MEFFELIENRQSIRVFQARAVEEVKLQTILQAANSAPSAGNFQAYEIFVVRRQEQRDILTRATFGQNFIAEAPVLLLFCMNPARCTYDGPALFALQDTTIACTFAMLAIQAAGLATCWIGAFSPENIAKTMSLPQGLTPVAILPVGYSAETPERTTRRSLNDLVHEI
ncbi:MAG TPA: nitroreductase family protein [Clostridia bacterium]|nr:nitroreductase family protein [Clostridia bacterium]